jgi:hypothetical protein
MCIGELSVSIIPSLAERVTQLVSHVLHVQHVVVLMVMEDRRTIQLSMIQHFQRKTIHTIKFHQQEFLEIVDVTSLQTVSFAERTTAIPMDVFLNWIAG